MEIQLGSSYPVYNLSITQYQKPCLSGTKSNMKEVLQTRTFKLQQLSN